MKPAPYFFAAALTLLSQPAAACPAAPETRAAQSALIRQLQSAPDERRARPLSDQLWELWTTAPDAHAQSLLDQGMSRRASYDFAGARALFDELVAYCPDYAEGYNQRAFIDFLTGDYEAALDDLETALKLSPMHIGAMSGKALTLLNQGRGALGQTVLREALELNPWLPERGMLVPNPAPPPVEL